MRYVFIGAGAVGSALGGLLSQAGYEVLLVARGAHATAISERGLRIRCPDTTFIEQTPCVTEPEQARLTRADVLVLTTKTHQAEAALAKWADVPVHDTDGRVVGDATGTLPVLTALNGVAGEDIALRYFQRVFGVCVWFPTVMTEPGEILVRGYPVRGIFHVGSYGKSSDAAADTAMLNALCRDWATAELQVRRSDDVMRWKYRKLVANVGNVLQALLGTTTGAEDMHRAAEAEARDILTAAGIAIPDERESNDAWAGYSTHDVPGQPTVVGGSTWQSLMRGGSGIETDYLNGEIALTARKLGRAAPINTGLAAIARRTAREQRRPGDIDADQLRCYLSL